MKKATTLNLVEDSKRQLPSDLLINNAIKTSSSQNRNQSL